MENSLQETENYLKMIGFIRYLAKVKTLGDSYGEGHALVGEILIQPHFPY